MSFEVKQLQSQVETLSNKINKFSEEIKNVQTERHKLKKFNDTMDTVSTELRGFRLRLEKLEKFSRNQHRRIRNIEDHLVIPRPGSVRKSSEEVKDEPSTEPSTISA